MSTTLNAWAKSQIIIVQLIKVFPEMKMKQDIAIVMIWTHVQSILDEKNSAIEFIHVVLVNLSDNASLLGIIFLTWFLLSWISHLNILCQFVVPKFREIFYLSHCLLMKNEFTFVVLIALSFRCHTHPARRGPQSKKMCCRCHLCQMKIWLKSWYLTVLGNILAGHFWENSKIWPKNEKV